MIVAPRQLQLEAVGHRNGKLQVGGILIALGRGGNRFSPEDKPALELLIGHIADILFTIFHPGG